MYPVSKKFQEAIQQTYREEYIGGSLWLYNTDGSLIDGIMFDETAIVKGSLIITEQLANGKIGYGGAFTRNLRVKLDITKIFDLNPVNINLTNAQIYLWYDLTLDDGTKERVLLWSFYINAKESSRNRNIFSLVAEDAMIKFDVESVGMTNVTPYQVYSKACELAGMRKATTEEEFSNFPNGTLKISFDTTQIETARDMLMWVAKLTGTIARAKVDAFDTAELIQIPTKYTRGGTSGNFNLNAFREDNGTIIPPDIRFNTAFTDTSVRITTIVMNRSDERIEYHTNWTFAPDTLEGTMEIENNPLLKYTDSSTVTNAIKALEQYTDDLRFCPSTVKFIGNPAIQIGDFVFLEKGGGIDDTTYRHYMIVTYSKWIYGGNHEIRCATDVAAERPKTSTISTLSLSGEPMIQAANSGISTLTETSGARPIAPKSQFEKSVRSAGIPDRITDNRYTEIIAGDFMRDGSFAVNEAAGINFYSKLSSPPIPYRPSAIKEKLPYASIGISDLYGDSGTQFEIIQFTEYGLDVNGHLIKYYNRLVFDRGHLLYEVYSPNGSKTIDLFGSVQKDYVDAQDESYLEQSKEYSVGAISAHNTDESAHSYIQGKISSVQNSVTSAWESIHEVEDRVSDLESGGTGGGYYTTKIAFKEGGFDLTFANKDGEETVNEFTIEETNGRITKITNTTAGKEIEVTYE